MDDKKVVWRALLDIVNLRKNAKTAEEDLRRLENRERSLGDTFSETDRKVSRSAQSQSRSARTIRGALSRVGDAYRAASRNTETYRSSLTDLDKAQRAYNSIAAKTEVLHNKLAASHERMSAATDRYSLAQSRVLDTQKKLQSAQQAYNALLDKQSVSTAKLEEAKNRLERAERRAARAAVLEAEASASVARAHNSQERAAKAAAKGNDDLALSLQRVHSSQLLVERAASSRFGRDQGRTLDSLKRGFTALERAAAGFTDVLLIKAPAAAGALGFLGSAVGALVAALTALGGALGPIIGLLGAIPGAVAGAATGVGTLVAAFKGVGVALKAYTKQQQGADKATATSAKAQQAAARQVRDAQRSVRDAYEAAARAAEASSERIENAEENLTRAQRDARSAQLDLNRARAEAIRQLEDLKRSVRDAGFSEEEATIALAEARKRLEEVRTSADSSQEDLARADLDYRQAIARLEDARKNKQEAIRENAEAQKKGVEGSDLVVAAQQRMAASFEGVAEAQKELVDAQRDAARQQRDSAEAIARALENQKDAQAGLVESYAATTAAADEYQKALDKLTPAGQRFVKYLISLKSKVESLQRVAQNNLLPGAQAGLESLMTLFPRVEKTVGNTASVIGGFFRDLGAKLAQPQNASAIGRIFTTNENNLKIFSAGVLALAGYFVKVADAARPLTTTIATIFKNWAEAQEATPTEELTTFFEKTQRVLITLGSILGNVWRGLKNVGRAGEDFGNDMLGSIDSITERWANWTGSLEGQNVLKQWFDDARPIVSAMAGLIGDITKGILDLSTSDKFAPFIQTLREEVLPNLSRFFEILAGNGAVGGFSDFLVAVSEALVKMAESGALGGLTKALEFLAGVVSVGSNIMKIPGIGIVLSTIAAALFSFKALKFAAAVTGLKSLYDGIKKLYSLRKLRGTRADDIQELIDTTGSGTAPATRSSVGFFSNTKKKQRQRSLALAAGEPLPSRTSRRPRMSGAGMAGAGAAVAIGASLLPLEGPLGTIISLFGILAGLLPVLIPAFAALAAAIGIAVGPLLLIVAAIAGVITAIVLLWKNNEGFRNFFIKAWNSIKDAAVNAWNNYIFPALKAFWKFVTDVLMPAIGQLWNNVIKPVFGAIGGFIAAAWTNFIRPALSALFGFIRDVLIPVIVFLWNNVVKPIFGFIGTYIATMWNGVIKPVFRALWGFISDVLAPIFKWLWNNVISPIMSSIGTGISNAWNLVIKPVFDALKKGLEAVGKAFEGAKTFIGKVWDGIVGVIQGPIQAVLKWIQQNLIDKINSLLQKIGVTNWKIGRIWTAEAGSTAGAAWSGRNRQINSTAFASGGHVGGHSAHDREDNIPAMLTAGEYVLPVPAVRKITRTHGANYLEHLRRGNVYADGGMVKPVNARPSFPWGRYPSGGLHRALDLPVPIGTPVRAPYSSDVIEAGWDSSGFGNHVRLRHPQGVYSILAHLSRLFVREGQRLSAGMAVGESGNTGRSTGPHLHFEMRTAPYAPDTAFDFTKAFNGGTLSSGPNYDISISGLLKSGLDAILSPAKNAINSVLGGMGWVGSIVWESAKQMGNGVLNKVLGMFGSDDIHHEFKEFAPRPTSGVTLVGHEAVDRFATGGRVPGSGNQDTVRALLTPGEFVLRKEAVKAVGLEALYAMNGGGGGKTRNGVSYFHTGGAVKTTSGVGRYVDGKNWIFANLLRYMLKMPYNLFSGISMPWGADVSKRFIDTFRGILPDITNKLNPNFGNTTLSKIVSAVNGGGYTWDSKRGITDVARILGNGGYNVDPITLAMAQSKYSFSAMDSRKRSKFDSQSLAARGAFARYVKDAQAALRLTTSGKYSTSFGRAFNHLVLHGVNGGAGMPHANTWPITWPMTVLDTAIAQQAAANELQMEFNRHLDTLSTWGLGDLVAKLLDMGPQDGISLARESVKDRSMAIMYNTQLRNATQIAATTSPEAYKFVSLMNSGANPGIRDAARTLGYADYAVVALWEKLVAAGRLNASSPSYSRMVREVSLFRQGLFYAATGGQVPGTGSGDTVPAMLTPGEFVLRKSAVRALGINNLRALNNMQYFATGGPVFSPTLQSVPGISQSGLGTLASRIMSRGNEMTTVNINTNIYNPVREPSTQSMNKMLRRKAAVGEFGPNASVNEEN